MHPRISARRKKKALKTIQEARNGVTKGMPAPEFYRNTAPLQVANRPFAFFSDDSTLAVVPGAYENNVLDVPTRPPSPSLGEPTDLYGDAESIIHENFPNPNYVGNHSGQQTAYSSDPSQLQRRTRQYTRWMNEVIPLLEHEYMEIMRKTQYMRYPISELDGECVGECTCNRNSTRLNVLCVSFNKLESREIWRCQCQSAPVQLMRLGFFPNTPVNPTLAVHLDLLELSRDIFHFMAPNRTAMSSIIQARLEKRGYLFDGKDCLRRRFAECIRWYCVVVDRVQSRVQHLCTPFRPQSQDDDDAVGHQSPIRPSSPTQIEPQSSPCARLSAARVPPMREGNEVHQDAGATEPHDDDIVQPIHEGKNDLFMTPVGTQASLYLQSRCPACFGKEVLHDPKMLVDVIVSCDGNFEHKRRHGGRDPPLIHPETVFLTEEEISRAKDDVESKRPVRQIKRRKPNLNPANIADSAEDDEDEDVIVPGMKVSESNLDGCKTSYTAAQETTQVNASVFSETGLISLICRHDHALFMGSMTSAGERQYYIVALIEKLFSHLPDDVKVGILYDIGCQTERSCVKYGILGRYRDRMRFGVSVFHAYGHQWACQLVYHPRKCEGFGLSDGEGCERVWSSLQSVQKQGLVSGYHSRIYTIDSQLRHLQAENFLRLGNWMESKVHQCYEKYWNAVNTIKLCGVPVETLSAEWTKQVAYQTKPLPRRSKVAAVRAIEELAALQVQIDQLEDSLQQISARRIDIGADEAAINAQIASGKTRLARLRKEEAKRKEALSPDGRTQLGKLKAREFIALRLNARALKIRLRSKLQSRKFELQRLNKSHHMSKPTSNDRKMDSLIVSHVSRRDPTITQLARNYNEACSKLEKLKSKGLAPRKAICPKEIELKELFQMDVDHDVWQDAGLYDEESDDVPLWMSEEKVRKGIRAWLTQCRCEEELARLNKEAQSLREWMLRQWNAALIASERESDQGLQFVTFTASMDLSRK